MKDLLAWFALKRFPFDKNIKSAETFASDSLAECTARLEYMKRRGGIMLLTGDPGVGKSLALRCFADHLNENLFQTFYTALSTLTRIDMLKHINRLMGLPLRASKSANHTQIQTHLLESREKLGKTIIFAIDEAQLLKTGTLEELRLLTNFRMDSFDPFILILSAQSEMRRTMSFAVMEPLRQRLAMTYHMPPLSEEETARYIDHHLKLAGSREPLLDEQAHRAVYDLSFGIPRRIGAIVNEALTYAMFDQKRSVSAEMLLKANGSA